ncbi:hypothetical protein GQ457_03G009230 [Hibiscus cannabinus]
MAKFTPTHAVILVLVFTVVSMVPGIEGGRCTEVLDPKKCVLNDCKKMCFQKHKSIGGQCTQSGGTPINPTFDCVCTYDCPL